MKSNSQCTSGTSYSSSQVGKYVEERGGCCLTQIMTKHIVFLRSQQICCLPQITAKMLSSAHVFLLRSRQICCFPKITANILSSSHVVFLRSRQTCCLPHMLSSSHVVFFRSRPTWCAPAGGAVMHFFSSSKCAATRTPARCLLAARLGSLLQKRLSLLAKP